MPKKFSQKFAACLFGGLIAGLSFIRIGRRFFQGLISDQIVLLIGLLIFGSALIYAFVWNGKKEQPAEDSLQTFSFWIGLTRYAIAFDLIMIGLQKLFGLQFSTPLAKLDLPFSSLSSEDLTWAFFGHSHGFVVIIGSLQILGSVFLLYNRTRLLGTTVLIPVMLNIVLIDVFYSFELGEWFHALALLLALIYLLLLDYEKLKTVFFPGSGSFKSRFIKSKSINIFLKLSAIYIPLGLIAMYPNPDPHPELTGKYAVSNLSVNSIPKKVTSCADTLLTTVYFDQGGECVFEFNNRGNRLFGIYKLQREKNQMEMIWHYPIHRQDTLQVGFSASGPNKGLSIAGKIGQDVLQASLRKMND